MLSLRLAEDTLRHLQGSNCSTMAVLKPHLIFPALPAPSLPALSPGHGALCSTDAELGTAKNTNTFFSLILHPVPTLQFKSQGAKQKTHTTYKHLFLSYPIFLPPQHMGHPEDDSDPIHLMGHMSCQQKTEAVQNKVSYLLFSSVASGRSPKHFSLSSDFKNMVYKEKCEISFLLPEHYRLDLERGIGVDRFTS